MLAGAATIVINNDIGTPVQGAGRADQRVESIRDDLEANALYLADDDDAILLVSCDLAGLETDRVRRYAAAMAAAAGIEAEAILIGCSHTHGGPVVLHTNYLKPIDETYASRLQAWLCELAAQAVAAAEPARLGWGRGAARLGYNRRVCYADGSHSMYRAAGRDAEFTGVEGPEDTDLLALGVWDAADRPVAILHQGTGHPASTYGRNELCADFPGLARRHLREVLGAIPVLFFNGAQGDIAMVQQAHPQASPDSGSVQIMRFACALAGETLRLLHEMRPVADPVLRHERVELELPVRQPTAAAVEQGRAVLRRMDAGEPIGGREAIFAWGPVDLHDRFGGHPVDRQAFHALRLGDVAIATQPFELFCQYQIDLKRRSPAPVTAVFGLTDGFGGYVPTLSACLGGGYSADAFSWTRFDPAVGHRFVEETARMLHGLWR